MPNGLRVIISFQEMPLKIVISAAASAADEQSKP
jgi:hypothetical protein